MKSTSRPKTSAQRMAAQRQRRAAAGLVQLNLYADKRDHATIKAFAADITNRRAQDAANQPLEPVRSAAEIPAF